MLREERARRIGHDTRAHYRSAIHGYAGQERLQPAAGAAITIDSLKARIAAAKQGLN